MALHDPDRRRGPLTWPNLITLLRLCAVPAVVLLILRGRLDIALMVFIAAGISDGLDGWLARATGTRSALGAVLDPVADKALLVSVYVTLAAVNVLPDWIAVLVVFRDLLIVGGYLVLWVAGHRMPIEPILVSKANTALQIALVALALAGVPEMLLDATLWLTAASTLLSGGIYVVRAARASAA
ncbi:CDP-alcohol phosphatidyltransferase family protein [Plastoroseomonas arctica]|uniref:CDP-alcohol phosphatidyltransferase family protein n=1 Tax=Plastoroseomonas arctica TaxID=1509237 RepID=UPI001FE28841|nr:CDP-alcohol phosphatidyltransferase family protein [Plastoroseomonas arctica]